MVFWNPTMLQVLQLELQAIKNYATNPTLKLMGKNIQFGLFR